MKTMGKIRTSLLVLALLPAGMRAQEFSTAIEDNSFLIEEAYNQEERVVQHISNLMVFPGSKNLLFSFTQEWPIGSQTHQLSYTIPYLSTEAGGNGIGDILINYRYQLSQTNTGWGYVAPRFSAVLPTGNRSKGLGSGAVGLQISLPISKRWSDGFVSHFNAGFTSLFDAEATDPEGTSARKSLFSFGLGASGIYLVRENFNLLLEVLFNRIALLDGEDVRYGSIFVLNPGFRFAINAGDLQIVPGLSMPIQFAPGTTELGVFAYLSFEHPF
jgi:hypothetical protein